MNKKIIFIAGFVFLSFCALSGFAQERVGVVSGVKGTFLAKDSAGAVKNLVVGDSVFLGDVIETKKESHLQVLLLDETVFSIGPESSLVIDEFVYDPSTKDGKLEASILKGVFRFVSGKIAKKKPENMEVNLPVGTIGIRGTIAAGIVDGNRSFIVLLGPEGSKDVPRGRITVYNEVNGELVEVEIDRLGYGTIIGGSNEAPIPVFKVTPEQLRQIEESIIPSPQGSGDQGTGLLGGAGSSGNYQDPDFMNQLFDQLNELSGFGEETSQDVLDKAGETASSSSSSSSSRSGNNNNDDNFYY